MPARVIVTCGPSYEPVDEVRRLTNHSTGELGILLANRLAADGWAVTCLTGEGATSPEPLAPGVARLPFTTNDSLQQQLAALPERKNVAHFSKRRAVRLSCETSFRRAGRAVSNAKISSRTGVITLELEPDGKVIGTLRGLFPRSRLVGWKYELDGTREDVVAKGQAADEPKTGRMYACSMAGLGGVVLACFRRKASWSGFQTGPPFATGSRSGCAESPHWPYRAHWAHRPHPPYVRGH